MNTNERIARGLGLDTEAKAEHQWTTLIGDHNIEWCERCCSSVNTCCGGEIADVGPCEPVWPDYEHSLDALLEPLGVLRERGWVYEVADDNPPSESVTNAVRIALEGQQRHIDALTAEVATLKAALQLIADGDCDFENGHDDIDDCSVAMARRVLAGKEAQGD